MGNSFTANPILSFVKANPGTELSIRSNHATAQYEVGMVKGDRGIRFTFDEEFFEDRMMYVLDEMEKRIADIR